MSEPILIPELNESFEDVSEFNDYASNMVDEYCQQLENQDGMKKDMEEDEKGTCEDNGWLFMWSDKASKLINAEINRLTAIGNKYFYEFDVEVSPTFYTED